jgi:hypothetical protein
VWELAVPNGSYRVHVVSGDPNHTDSVFRTNVEGVLAVSGTPTTSTRWFEGWVNVNVVDGRLTISNGSGASNNKINFVDVIPLGFDFSTGFTASAGLTRNGTAAVSGTALRLTSGLANQAGSAFSTGRINTSRFSTRFDFRLTNPAADGITFTIQNSAATALGPSGGGLGFGPDTTGGTGGIASSIAVKFDLYNNQGEGINSTGLFLNGAAPTVGGVAPALGSNDLTGSGIDLHSGHTFRAHIAYDGSRLLVTITDLTTGATATQAYLIDLASVLGGSTAFVGFTGGTGGLTATQDVLSWWYFPS